MNNDKGMKKFGLGVFIGSVIGVVVGLLLAPKSGKELREDAAKRMRELKHKYESGELQRKIKNEINKKMEEVKGKLSRSQYAQMIDEAIDKVKKTGEIATEEAERLRDRLLEEWRGE